MSRARRGPLFLAVVAVWLILDQLTKQAIVHAFEHPGARVLTLIPGYLDLTFTYNTGAAFGLLNSVAWSRFFFIAIAAGALLAMVLWRRSLLALPALPRYALALVGAGAAGNLVDRLARGKVVDFIHFKIDAIGFVWPDFNVADIGVTCGMLCYVGWSLWQDLRRDEAAGPPGAPDSATDGR